MVLTPFRKSRGASTRSKLKVSFEFFPPKTEEMEKTLWESIDRLAPLGPSFVSVTYGAGGSTRERTHNTVAKIVKETRLKPAAHLTCVAATRDEIDGVIRDYWSAGVRHIVALRGDPQTGAGTRYEPHPGGYAYTPDLIAGIKAIGDFDISVSAYPEKHPDSASVDDDIEVLTQCANGPLPRHFGQRSHVDRGLDLTDNRIGLGIDSQSVGQDQPVQLLLCGGAATGEHGIGAGPGEQDPAPARVGRGEFEDHPDSSLQPGTVCVRKVSHRRGQGLAQLVDDLVVQRSVKGIDIDEVLVEVPRVQRRGPAHRPDRYRGLAAVTEQLEARSDKQSPPFGLSVRRRNPRPARTSRQIHTRPLAVPVFKESCCLYPGHRRAI